MYARRFATARPTGFRNTSFKIAKKIAKLMSCSQNVPSRERNPILVTHGRLDERRDVRDGEEQVQRKTQTDDRERFQDADAEE